MHRQHQEWWTPDDDKGPSVSKVFAVLAVIALAGAVVFAIVS